MGFLLVLWLIDIVDVTGNFVVRVLVCIYNYKIESRQLVMHPAISNLRYLQSGRQVLHCLICSPRCVA